MESDAQARGDDDLAGNGYLQFQNGAQAFVRTMPRGAADWDFEVIGTRGRLRVVADAEEVEWWRLVPASLEGRRRRVARHLFPLADSGPSANTRTVLDLVACLQTGDEPTANGDLARHALEVAIALRESHRRGGVRVDLPLADRTLSINSSETLAGDEPVAVRRARAAPIPGGRVRAAWRSGRRRG
jgi:predicted dehydrogenase